MKHPIFVRALEIMLIVIIVISIVMSIAYPNYASKQYIRYSNNNKIYNVTDGKCINNLYYMNINTTTIQVLNTSGTPIQCENITVPGKPLFKSNTEK